MADSSGVNGTATRSGPSRRQFLKGVGVAAVAAEGLLARAADTPAQTPANPAAPGAVTPPGLVQITLDINGKSRTVTVEPRTTLLSALRDRLLNINNKGINALSPRTP